MAYHNPADDKTYKLRTIEDFIDISNLLKEILPNEPPAKDILFSVEQTLETYMWNYRTRSFDLVVDY